MFYANEILIMPLVNNQRSHSSTVPQVHKAVDRATALADELTGDDRLAETHMIAPAFYPVVRLQDRVVCGLEVLARSTQLDPAARSREFDADAPVENEIELNQLLRREGILQACPLHEQMALFLNTHPAEVGTSSLIDGLKELRMLAPDATVVFEILESAFASPKELAAVARELSSLEMHLAVDNFGDDPALARILLEYDPSFAKVSIERIAELEQDSPQRDELADMIKAAMSKRVKLIAKGVETNTQAEIALSAGFEFAQGLYVDGSHG